ERRLGIRTQRQGRPQDPPPRGFCRRSIIRFRGSADGLGVEKCRAPLPALCPRQAILALIAAMAEVRNNESLSRFELETGGHMAVANYRLSDRVMTFTHTEVPAAMREHGIASRLIHHALTQARAKGLKVIARCSFVHHYIATH